MKLCKIKFIPFKRLRNLDATLWIETSFELAKDRPFSEKFIIAYDNAITRMAPNYTIKDSHEDIFKSLVQEWDLSYIPFCDTYAYTYDSLYVKKEEKKLNKGIDLFKNIVFIPAKLFIPDKKTYNKIIYSFYILCP